MGSTQCQPSQLPMMAWFRRAGLYLLVPHGSPNFLWSIPPNFCDTAPILKHTSCFYIPTFYIFYIPTLNPNVPKNYRPLTLSSTHSELIEMLIMPKDELYNTHFGFRESRGTSMPCVLINDIASYFNDRGSPLYICSLDAEKCLDSIWPYCINLGKSSHYTTGFLCIDGTII